MIHDMRNACLKGDSTAPWVGLCETAAQRCWVYSRRVCSWHGVEQITP